MHVRLARHIGGRILQRHIMRQVVAEPPPAHAKQRMLPPDAHRRALERVAALHPRHHPLQRRALELLPDGIARNDHDDVNGHRHHRRQADRHGREVLRRIFFSHPVIAVAAPGDDQEADHENGGPAFAENGAQETQHQDRRQPGQVRSPFLFQQASQQQARRQDGRQHKKGAGMVLVAERGEEIDPERRHPENPVRPGQMLNQAEQGQQGGVRRQQFEQVHFLAAREAVPDDQDDGIKRNKPEEHFQGFLPVDAEQREIRPGRRPERPTPGGNIENLLARPVQPLQDQDPDKGDGHVQQGVRQQAVPDPHARHGQGFTVLECRPEQQARQDGQGQPGNRPHHFRTRAPAHPDRQREQKKKKEKHTPPRSWLY